jgi:hypothetical protein
MDRVSSNFSSDFDSDFNFSSDFGFDTDLGLLQIWYDWFKDYSILKHLFQEGLKPVFAGSISKLKRLRALKELIPSANAMVLIPEAIGTNYDIYKELMNDKPQPVPELMSYTKDIIDKYSTDPVWSEWASIFDRSLTRDQRQILKDYRRAFVCFLTNNDKERARGTLELAKHPFTYRLTDPYILYSESVLRYILEK